MTACTLLVVLAVATAVYGQVPIPKREVGYVYNGGSCNAPAHLDVYIDIMCPDSKEAFPTMLQLGQTYGPDKLQVKSHLFPLPYHRASFLATKGLHAVSMLTGGNQSYPWISLIYDNLDSLSNDAIRSWSEDQLVSHLGNLAEKLGVKSADFVKNINENEDIELDTRVAWKYACTRGVAGTPTFMVNDVVVAADPSWTVAQWQSVIDPILGIKRARTLFSKGPVLYSCPPDTKTCEYLPGKVECCTKGENCIPNVGCRC